MKAHWLALAGILFASCASSAPTGTNLGGPPDRFLPYPALKSYGIVNAKAEYAYPAIQKRDFLTNVLDRVGIIPVRLTVSLGGKGAGEAQIPLTTDNMNPRLFLQNGVSLPQVDPDSFFEKLSGKQADAVRANMFRSSHLTRTPTSGYIFFSIQPDKAFELDDNQLIHTAGGVTRTVDIDRSLLVFSVTIENHPQPFFVGIRP